MTKLVKGLKINHQTGQETNRFGPVSVAHKPYDGIRKRHQREAKNKAMVVGFSC